MSKPEHAPHNSSDIEPQADAAEFVLDLAVPNNPLTSTVIGDGREGLAQRAAHRDELARYHFGLVLTDWALKRISDVLPSRPQLRMFHDDNGDMQAIEYLGTALATNDTRALKAIVARLKTPRRGPAERDWETILAWYKQTKQDLAAFVAEWSQTRTSAARGALFNQPIGQRIVSAGLRDDLIAGRIGDLALAVTAREQGVEQTTIRKMMKKARY